MEITRAGGQCMSTHEKSYLPSLLAGNNDKTRQKGSREQNQHTELVTFPHASDKRAEREIEK